MSLRDYVAITPDLFYVAHVDGLYKITKTTLIKKYYQNKRVIAIHPLTPDNKIFLISYEPENGMYELVVWRETTGTHLFSICKDPVFSIMRIENT